MAAVSQPGSRAGLISALVIFVILFFIAGIFAIVNATDKQEALRLLEVKQREYDDVITRSELASEKPEIETAVKEAANAGLKYTSILKRERNELAKAITGQPVKTAEATKQAEGIIVAVNKQLEPANASAPGGSLVNAVQVLADAVLARQQKVAEKELQVKKVEEEKKQDQDKYAKEVEQHKVAAEAAAAKALAAKKQEEDYRQTKDKEYADLEKKRADEIAAKDKEISDKNDELARLNAEVAKATKESKGLRDLLAKWRPRNVAESMIRRPDGKILQVGKGSVCYINLGYGQQITRGMTFEIYDRNEGIPPTGTGPDDELPVGKGSLEVVNISQGSSECRIIKMQPGQQLFEGDLIANLIYNPDVKFKFKVYGDFDIDQNNVATANEAEIVKRLVLEWGGALTDKVDASTDFLVLGKEPVVPNYTKDQLESSALLKFERDKAEAALKAYDKVKEEAVNLHIPVLNQNRFLYMVGFYDQAKK